MNKHVTPDSIGNVIRLVAVPEAGDIATYQRLHELRLAAHALEVSITRYLNTPAIPPCANYREERLSIVETDIADLRKALSDG